MKEEKTTEQKIEEKIKEEIGMNGRKIVNERNARLGEAQEDTEVTTTDMRIQTTIFPIMMMTNTSIIDKIAEGLGPTMETTGDEDGLLIATIPEEDRRTEGPLPGTEPPIIDEPVMTIITTETDTETLGI